ncbi:MAG: filamentous hemagglutinin N-terminal domain-containing protein, partial [Verrucomicrobiales bacterium]|nr:filamentous hemagglutinin N-terminal domain-containing protein [Verrucomicrobiales bacterium]
MTRKPLQRSSLIAAFRRSATLQIFLTIILTPGLSFWTVPLQANPMGGSVIHGDVNIGAGGGGNLQIQQNSANAIINWESFSIQAGELTQFLQPGSNAAVLNRVTGGDPTAILGALKGNGNVFLINPNGILVGAGGTIDVHGLVLSTLDVSNGEFLAGGDMVFEGVGEGITNMGRINAIGGDVFLIGRTVTNSGSITAKNGTVGLAAGEEVLLTSTESRTGERLFVRSKGAGVSGTGILNDGTIEGAAVELKAHGNMFALAINNKGSIRATGATSSGGRVFLSAPGGRISNSGSIRASSPGVGRGGMVAIEAAYAKVDGMIRAEAGKVRITGTSRVELGATVDVSSMTASGGDLIVEGRDLAIGSTAVITASGDTGGGSIRIGGGFQGKDEEVVNAHQVIISDGAEMEADAFHSGVGGNIIVWSDGGTEFSGTLSARGVSKGGFAEISGKNSLAVDGIIDLSASDGSSGTLLLDPTDITITSTGASTLGGSTLSNVWLSEQLDFGTNVIITTDLGGTQAGNITVGRTDNTGNAASDRIQWYQDSAGTPGGTLTLLAAGDILFNTTVQSAGQGGLNVVAGWDGVTGLTTGDFDMVAVLATMNDGNSGNDAAGLFNTVNGTNGSVFLGATNSRIGVAVGSRWGDTKLAASDLVMRGSISIGHGWAQLGFNDNGVEYELSRTQNGVVLNEWWGSTAGNVQGKDYIALLGGTEFGTGNTLMLGAKAFRGAGWGATGDITAALSGRVDARGGTTASYTQIGHGGILRDGSEDHWSSTSGNALNPARVSRDEIQIAPGDNRRSFWGSTWRTNYAGDAARIDADINVTADGDILMMGARGFDGATDDQIAAIHDGAYTMIGHGGVENQGSYHGDITVTAHGATAAPTSSINNGLEGLGIQLIGGRGTRSYAMIGHGSGYEGNARSIWDQTRSGDINVTATTGAIRLLGHNQALRVGDINTGTLVGADEAVPTGQSSDNSNLGSFVQIGHGGQNSSYLYAGGTFIMPGSSTNVNNITPDGSMTGNIDVFAGGTFEDPNSPGSTVGIQVQAGNRRWFHAMIGHGGTNHRADQGAQTINFGAGAILPSGFSNSTLAASSGFNGNIRVEADKGDLIVAGGDSFRADRVWGYGYNFAQVGHGGDVVRGNKGGTITVLAGQGAGALSGDIHFRAGRMLREHAQLGHGGTDSDGDILGAANSAEIIVTAFGSISFVSPESGDKDALGLSADYASWWSTNTNQPGYYSTEDRYVMLGHGGYASTLVMPNRQDITIRSGTGDMANADGDDSTGGITFVAGDMERDFAQLGHGGHSSGANDANGFTGDITVTANGGGIAFDASILGAQGVRRATDRSLDGITTGITTVGYGGGYEAYAQLGHGGYAARGANEGNIVINAWGGLKFEAASAAPAVGRTVTSAPIDAAINAGTNVWVQLANLRNTASTTPFQTSEISSNVIPGTIRIELSDGRIITDIPRNSSDDRNTVNSDSSPNGLFLDGVKVGDADYDSGRIRFDNTLVGTGTGTEATVTFQTAQGLKEKAYVQLGHGGYEADGPNTKANDLTSNKGNITIGAGGDILFQGGAAHRNYAQLGHGGYETKGASSGDITIDAVDGTHQVGGIRFLAGHGGHRQFDYYSYAQLGHGGIEADGNHFGNIYIRGTEDADGMGLLFKAGDRQDAGAQLGHGGFNSKTGSSTEAYGLNGDINVQVTGDIAFVAGTLTTNNPEYRDDGRLFAQIGHGGYSADATNSDTNFFGATGDPLIPVGTAGAGDGNWGHFGDITLVSSGGNISFMAGSTIPVADRVDLDGNPLPIAADPNGFLISHGDGKGRFQWAQAGHGGYAAGGDHHGNITVIAENGSVHVVGGMITNDNSAEKYNWSQIGHGGGEEQGHLGRTNEKILVHALGATGDILVAAGNGNRNQAHIGNGGLNYDGSHSGDIEVYAGRNVEMRGGVALARVVKRVGEFQDMYGTDGGHSNDISEFEAYYGASGLGYVLLDEAAATGGGAKTKLIGDEIQAGTVEFRLAIAAPALFDANQDADYIDVDNGDGTGNIVEAANPGNVVGTINYATGELQWDIAIVASDTSDQPDVFVNYAHNTEIRNDALYANATIGHGGYASGSMSDAHPEDLITPGFVNRGISGNIDVRAGVNAAGAFNASGGSITAIAGNDQRTWVQIGHGGMDATAPTGHSLSGAITTKADGAITFRGGGGLIDNQHIAFNYYGAGNTEVAAVTAAHNLTINTPDMPTALGSGTRSYSGISDNVYAFAHIGHGGVSVHANNNLDSNANDPLVANTPEVGHNGDILVETSTGNIDFTGGGVMGYGHFVQIGHGGISDNGSHFGDIEVISGADINFTAGGASYRANSTEKRSYAQIGHGGYASAGNLLGDIDVLTTGKLSFTAGDGNSDRANVPYGAHVYVLNYSGNQDENHYNRAESRQNHAMIGHGGSYVTGDKTGEITVGAGSGIDFRGGDSVEGSGDNNSGYLNFAMIGHGGYQSWRQIRTGLSSSVLPDVYTYADTWNLPYTHDGTQFIFDGTGTFMWPSDNSIDAAKGFGNPLYDGFSGDVNVSATSGDISFSGGTGLAAFTQIGHGGVETGGDHNGEITVTASNGDIIFSANRIEETGSSATSTYTFAKIGHGGAFSSGEQSGGINVEASGEIRFKAGRSDSFAMVGHGGRESHGSAATGGWGTGRPDVRHSSNYLNDRQTMYRPGSRTGDISVLAGGDIEFVGGNENGDRAFTQIGHGGFQIHANPDPLSQFGDGHSGDITVKSTGGSLLLRGGDRANAHALIGHGGTESFGNHGGDGKDNRADSDIYVEASTGIRVMATGRFDSNNVARNFAQIGHGGWRSSFRDIDDIDGAQYAKLQFYGSNYINPLTGTTNDNDSGLHPLTPFTTNQDGNALGPLATLGTFKGDITVRTTGGGDIQFLAPNADSGTLGRKADDSYVQLGHGGWRNFADIEGNIVVESDGALEFSAVRGTGLAGYDINHNLGYALLGHGGYESGGKYTGNIDVTTNGDILFRGGDSIDGANASFAQLGHGGYSTWVGTGQYREALRDPVTGVAPGSLYSVGSTGDITVDSGGDIEFFAGRDNITYAQLGHGGYASRDSHTGEIDVTAKGGISFIASIDDVDGPGNNAGNNNDSWAQLGHGGVESDGSHDGNITVRAGEFGAGHEKEGYGLYFKSGNWDENYSQLGHGGYGARSYGNGVDAVGFSGNIDVEVNGDITFVAGTYGADVLFTNEDGRNYTQLGHGGYEADTSQDNANVTGLFGADGKPIGHHGDIRVVARDGSVNFLSGDINRSFEPSAGLGYGNNHYAQLGHGGISSHGNHYGNITVQAGIASDLTLGSKADGDVLFASGGSSANEWADIGNYAMLGHGGRSTEGNFGKTDATTGAALETITVLAGRDITFSSERGDASSYVQLGHGGWYARGDHAANFQVFAERNLSFIAGSSFDGTPALGAGHFASYGHGSRTDGNNLTINQDRAANLGDGADFNLMYNRVVPGSLVITIRLDDGTIIGTLSDPDGDGTLTADAAMTADFQDTLGTRTIAAGTHVGNVVYSDQGTSTVTFLEDVNPGTTAPSTGNDNLGDGGTVNLWVQFEHGDQDQSYAMLGNGGWETDGPNEDVTLGHRGDISITTRTGDLRIQGGSDDDTFAQVGHGGRSTKGANTGNIEIDVAGSMGLISGSLNRAYAVVGHGGYDSDGDHTGDICIHVGKEISLDASQGDGYQALTQIGHGQYASSGNHTGFITVVSGLSGADGGISLIGGNVGGNYQWAQIGHGGISAAGDHTGDITVIDRSGKNIQLTGGTASYSYALIGHGDGGNNSGGARSGDIYVETEGSLLTTNGGPSNSIAFVGHQSTAANEGITPGTVDTSLILGSINNADFNFSSFISAAAFGGMTTIATMASNLVIDDGVNYNSAFGVNLLSAKDVIFTSGLQNAGTGDVNVVAGWNGSGGRTTLDYNSCRPVGTASAFDFNTLVCDDHGVSDQGSVYIGNGNQSAGVAVGSRAGATSVYGHRVSLTGSDTVVNGFAQIGFRPTSASSQPGLGAISVDIHEGGFALQGGLANGTYSQVGHGGLGAGANNQNGAITISFCEPGEVLVSGGGANAYAQIGHGGAGAGGSKDGAITLSNFTKLDLDGGSGGNAYSQIGHGGTAGFGAIGAAVGRIDITGTPGSAITLDGGSNSGAGVQIGHGGGIYNGALSGDIGIANAAGTLGLTGGTDASTVARIGHGGFAASGEKTSNLEVLAETVILTGGSGTSSEAQIGSGGRSGTGVINGNIRVESTVGNIELHGGDDTFSVARIGHGGESYHGSVNDQSITVTSANDLLQLGGAGVSAGTQIGHGGANAAGAGYSGAVVVNGNNDIIVSSGSKAHGFSQIGNGGASSDATLGGNIVVNAGREIRLTGNPLIGGYAQIGNGDDTRGAVANQSGTGDRSGNIQVAAGTDVTLSGALIGNQNSISTASGVSGITQIGVSRDAPSDETVGNLIADSESQIQGSDEIRVYLPRRENNQVAPGALLNEEVWSGAPIDPSLEQRIDEYTINIIGVVTFSPMDHGNDFSTGSSPTHAAGCAFYYDT